MENIQAEDSKSMEASTSNVLELVQVLPTSGARAATAFLLNDRQYLAIPQLAEDIPGAPSGMNLGNSDVSMIIYQMNESYFYEEFQRLPVPGGEDAEFFTIDGRHFLATASIRSGDGPYNLEDVSSTIFEWQDTKFVEFQRIPTFGAKQWRHFKLEGRHFLALAQGLVLPEVKPKIATESAIFEWDSSTSSFRPFQTVPSAWGYNWLQFSVAGHDFLAYADQKTPSVIFRWEGSHFVHFQTLGEKVLLGRAFCFIEADGEALLAFANIADDTLLYYWDGHRFQIRQRLEGPGGREFTLVKRPEGTYLVHIRFITGTSQAPNTALESAVYRLESGYLKKIATFPTFGGTDVTAISVKDETWLVVCQSLTKDQRFRVDTQVYRFKPSAAPSPKTIQENVVYQSPEFLDLFEVYTASKTSLGSKLTKVSSDTTASYPLLVATSSAMIFFPGSSRKPSYINFRLSNRGFKELAAISHLGPALASLVQIYNTDPDADTWRIEAQRLLEAIKRTSEANSTELWRDKIQVQALQGREAAIAAMVDYACSITVKYLSAVLEDPSKLTAEFLQREYLEGRGATLGATVPFNAVMIATFFLVGLDIAYRMRLWLQDQDVDWVKAMVVIVGKQGRETAGVTLATNSVAQIIFQGSNLELPPERLYIAPHGPEIGVIKPNDINSIGQYEAPLRSLWNKIHATAALGPVMFAEYPRYTPQLKNQPFLTDLTTELSDMPLVRGPDDWMALNTRMRIVLEDPRQLLSGCVTDYAAEQLRLNNNDPTIIVVPGLDHFDYRKSSKDSLYPVIDRRDPLGESATIVFSTSPTEFETSFTFPGRTCSVTGGEIAFWEEGHGKQTIIWIHGLPLDSRCWTAQRQHFVKDYRNIYMDLRGYGKSSKLPAGVDDVTQLYCNDIEMLMDHLKLKQGFIVGFASAGHVALRFAAQNPDRVEKLVTINASPCFRRGPDWPWGFSDEDLSRFTAAAASRGIQGITDMVLDPNLVFRDLSPSDAEKVSKWFTKMSYNAGVETLLGFFNHISQADDRHSVSSIKAPTLLIAGSMGQEVPSQSGLFLRHEIPNARLVEVPDADHFMFITRPVLVNQLISGFLSNENGG